MIAAYLWRPLPYPESPRLVVVDFPRLNGPGPLELQKMDWTGVRAFAELVVASDVDSFTVLGADTPFSVNGRWMTADAFTAFGVVPVAGRFFTADEAARNEPLAVIGHQVWQDHYGGSPSAIGQSITVRATLRQGEAETHTIIGVLPPRFWHLEERTSLILPLRGSTAPLALRLRPEVAPHEAGARLTAMVRTQVPAVGPEWAVTVRVAHDAHTDRIRPMLAATAWGVLLLGAVAFANLTFLQMARGVARQREMAVRSALGASRRDLVRQLLREGASVGVGAAVVGVVTAAVILRGGVPSRWPFACWSVPR